MTPPLSATWRSERYSPASTLNELVEIARARGLERIEAEFIGERKAAMKLFGMMRFLLLCRFEDYVKNMQAVKHDYILMALDLKTDKEYAGVG